MSVDEHVDCPRCGHCCPDGSEILKLRITANELIERDTYLLRQALFLINAYEKRCDPAMHWREIEHFKECLK